ncbi:MAG: DUF6798 domain-containing protein [Isosphaeraceae bacterium]
MDEKRTPSLGGARWLPLITLLGLFLTIRGYRSLEGDQAYRFPMLVHAIDPRVLADDPFVSSFREFNPHRGSLALIQVVTPILGLPGALFTLFALTFFVASRGIVRLAEACWPSAGPAAGWVGFGLMPAALAGNIGTNHLFEPILLDRQMAFALGWVSIAWTIAPGRRSVLAPFSLALAGIIHPTIGIQLATLLVGFLAFEWLLGGAERSSLAALVRRVVMLGIAIAPGVALNLTASGTVLDGIPTTTFRLLSLEIQGPQHMVPHLWRSPQWMAWLCYPWLVPLTLMVSKTAEESGSRRSRALRSVVLLLAVTLGFLAAAWVGVEVIGWLRLTLFQPFRMATICRGLCLVVLSGHVVSLWQDGSPFARVRAALLLLGLAGDWLLIWVTVAETLWLVVPRLVARLGPGLIRSLEFAPGWLGLGWGCYQMARHDTESGHVPLLLVIVTGTVGFRWLQRFHLSWTHTRQVRVALFAWTVPGLAFVVGLLPDRVVNHDAGLAATLIRRCRFTELPVDDFERLALWCRAHTPVGSRFVGPPGPKGFRIWARRNLAFNRAGSPYTARGLADWAERFQEHVGFRGTIESFARAYLRDRHRLEMGYERMTTPELVALARSQGADHVVTTTHHAATRQLLPLHRVGKWAVYRVSEVQSVAAVASGDSERAERD